MPDKIIRTDFQAFRYELERAILETDQEHIRNHLTRAKFLGYLLSRSLEHTDITMFSQVYDLAVSAAHASSDKKEKTQAFRKKISTLKYELAAKYKFQ